VGTERARARKLGELRSAQCTQAQELKGRTNRVKYEGGSGEVKKKGKGDWSGGGGEVKKNLMHIWKRGGGRR